MQTSIATWLKPKVTAEEPLEPSAAASLSRIEVSDPEPTPQARQLARNVQLKPCTAATLGAFKRLNALIPIPYTKRFYDEILSDPCTASVTKLAIWNQAPLTTTDHKGQATPPQDSGLVVGGIRCRILTKIEDQKARRDSAPFGDLAPDTIVLYIATLIVSPAFRDSGVASALLEAIVHSAVREHGVTVVGAHVWVANQVGRAWYAKRGFVEQSVDQGYYRRLEPKGAVLVSRRVDVMDHLGAKQ